jgi:hypothetical protein
MIDRGCGLETRTARNTPVKSHQYAVLTAVALSAVLSAATGATAAQNDREGQAAADAAPTPRLPNGKPDLSGVWTVPYVPDMSRNGRNQKGQPDLPFTREGQKNFSSYDPANGDYTGSCLPFGLVRSMNAPYPLQIIQNVKYMGVLWEQSNWFHVIPTDGRATPSDPNPQWFGTSIGHWDGDTLVVETSGFNGYTRLDTAGHPHSDALKVRQTFTRPDANRIVYTITIDDPKMYTRPWSNERTFVPSKGELIEYSCEENNKSLWEGRIKPWTPPWASDAKRP